MAHLKLLEEREQQKKKAHMEKINQEKKTREDMIHKNEVKRREEARKLLEGEIATLKRLQGELDQEAAVQ